jgi:hypothetical protein
LNQIASESFRQGLEMQALFGSIVNGAIKFAIHLGKISHGDRQHHAALVQGSGAHCAGTAVPAPFAVDV